MTQEIQWGPEVLVEDQMPDWLKGGDMIKRRYQDETSYGHPEKASEVQWDGMRAIRLPADHPHYRQTEAAPIDWSGELEAVHEDGRVVRVTLQRGPDNDGDMVTNELLDDEGDATCYWTKDGLPSPNVEAQRMKWRIRNVPQSTPQADTKPDLTARMEALVREVHERGAHAFITQYMATEARAIVALLPEPVDPVEAIVDELMRKDCTTRQAIEEAVHRGRALALAGEKEA